MNWYRICKLNIMFSYVELIRSWAVGSSTWMEKWGVYTLMIMNAIHYKFLSPVSCSICLI